MVGRSTLRAGRLGTRSRASMKREQAAELAACQLLENKGCLCAMVEVENHEILGKLDRTLVSPTCLLG